MKLIFFLELTPRYSLKRKGKRTTKDIISIGISDTAPDPGPSKGKEDSWIFPTWGHTLKNFPHSECLQELAAAYHLYAYKVWYYRKHQHSHYTDCPQSLQAGRVCLAFPVLHRNSHRGCWVLHLETSLVIALKVGFCWKHFVGAVVWPLKKPLVLAHLFCPPHCCCWSFEALGDCHSGSFVWAAPEIQNIDNKGGNSLFTARKARCRLNSSPLQVPWEAICRAERAQGLEL